MNTLKIIDFTGVPGAGKSTLSRAVYKNFNEKYICMNSEDITRILAKKKRLEKLENFIYSLVNSK